jgi:AraC family transcriptional regulator
MFDPTASRNVYTTRIHHVITYITEHLAEELSLEVLARQAHFSPYHFHRIFTALVGETPNAFVNRLRVERAAWLLLRKRAYSVTEIALDCGFSSSAAFARAFKQAFGMSATAWRRSKDRKIRQRDRKEWKDKTAPERYRSLTLQQEPDPQAETHQLNVTVTRMPRFHVAYVANLQGYHVEKIMAAWKQLHQWASARDLITPETVGFGVSLDDPDITPVDKCRYYVCITVPDTISGDEFVGIMDIPGGKYAVYRFEGTQPELHVAYRRLYSEWLPDSGYQPANSPCYEICRRPSNDPLTEAMIMEIYIPIVPLSQMWS